MNKCSVCSEGEIVPKNDGYTTSSETVVHTGVCDNCGQTYSMDFELIDYQIENF